MITNNGWTKCQITYVSTKTWWMRQDMNISRWWRRWLRPLVGLYWAFRRIGSRSSHQGAPIEVKLQKTNCINLSNHKFQSFKYHTETKSILNLVISILQAHLLLSSSTATTPRLKRWTKLNSFKRTKAFLIKL